MRRRYRPHRFLFFRLVFAAFGVFFRFAAFAPPAGFALTSTAATMHGSVPRTLHEWFVPR